MNQSNYSEKEPDCCCHVYFKNYEDLEAHRKNDCPKISKTPSPSAVPSDVTANTSKTSRQTQVELLTDHSTPSTLSCVEALKLAMESKSIALEAFIKENKEFECAMIAYKEVVQKKRETFKVYYEDRKRQKGLTANSEEENRRNCQRRLQTFSQAEAILEEEEDAERRLQRALSRQNAAGEVNSMATIRARIALIEAEKSREQLREQSSTPTLQSQNLDALEIEKVLMEVQINVRKCENVESEFQDTVNSSVEVLLMLQEAERNENAIFFMERRNENTEASTSDNQEEVLVADFSQFQQILDVSTSSVSDDGVSSSGYETDQGKYA